MTFPVKVDLAEVKLDFLPFYALILNMLSKEQLAYIEDHKDSCWNFLQNPTSYRLVFPVVKSDMIVTGIDYKNASFSVSGPTFEQHSLSLEDLKEYFKDKQFDKDIKEFLE